MISEEETIIEHDLASRQIQMDPLLETQKRAFQEAKKAVGLTGIVDYHPSMQEKVGDCCLSLIPFISSLVVIMHAAEQCSAEARAEFAFLARIFPFGQFIEILPCLSLKERLVISTVFAERSRQLFIALSADYVIDIEEMTSFLMRKELPVPDSHVTEVQLPLFFCEATSMCKKDSRFFRPWCKTKEHMNVLHHPSKREVMSCPPSNLITMGEKELEKIEVARYLGLL